MIKRLNETKWILFFAGAAYALVLSRFYIGYWSDDGRDILAAHSLLSGHYLNWQLPGHPPANFPLPGFPFILAPFTALFFHHPAGLRGVPFLLTLACIPLLNAVAKPWLNRQARICLLMLFALNPTTVVASGRVMADACFMAVTLGGFLLFQRMLEDPQTWRVVCTAALVGLAAIVRPEGALLIPAFATPLFFSKGRRTLGWFLPLSMLPLLDVGIRNYGLTGELSGYGPLWRASMPLLTGQFMPLLRNAALEFATLGVGLVGGWDFNVPAIPFWVWGVTALITFLMVKGMVTFARMPEQQTPVIAAFALYAASFFLLHSVWLAIDLHYLWPLLPVVLILGLKGFQVSDSWFQKSGALLLLILLGAYAFQYVHALDETNHPASTLRFPENTLQWIARHTLPTDFFLTPNAPLVTLYAQRFAIALVEAPDEDAFRYRLLQKGITHVLCRPTGFLYVQTEVRTPDEMWEQARLWMDADPVHFPRVFGNAAEGSQVYAVLPDPEFTAAFERYLQAREAMDQGQLDRGLVLLEDSFKHQRLPGALNAYATACLLKGDHLLTARQALKEALAQRPQFPAAALNLARLYKRAKDNAEARVYFETARTLSLGNTGTRFLIPVIDREEQEMR